MPAYFQHESAIRAIALGITAAALAPSINMVLHWTDWSLHWYVYVIISIVLFVAYFLFFRKILERLNGWLIWGFGGDVLEKKKKECALLIVTALFDRQSIVELPEYDDDLVMRQAVRSCRKYFERGDADDPQENKRHS